MARPTRTNAEYFYHPASFRNDRRVKAIRARYGAAGYGLLLMLIELLTDADNIELSTDEMELELLAGDLATTVEEITTLVQAAEKVGLFVRTAAGLLKCPQLDEWLAPVFEKRNRSRAAAAAGQKSNAPWLQHTQAVLARDGHKCKHCGTSTDLTLDHIIPRVAGGSDEITNLQTLCSSCNSAKGSNLSQSVTVIQPVENSTVEYSKEETTSSLQSEVEAAPEKKIVPEQPAENPADASHTRGGGADVGTRKGRGRARSPAPPPGSSNPADYNLPEWADASFLADATEWLGRRQSRSDVRPLQTAAVQEYFTELAGYTPEFCQQLFSESRKHLAWQGLTFKSTPLDFAQHILKLQQLQANANRINQPERGAKPTEAASYGARAVSAQLRAIREERRAQNGSYVDTGAAAGANAGLGSPVPPGIGAPQG